MALNESFRPRKFIHEKESFDLIGKARQYREVIPDNFDGYLKEWAEYRAINFGDSIRSIMTFPEGVGDDVHRVSWVFHAGFDAETGHNFADYHIACDCILMAELSGEPDSFLECPTLHKTVNRRAAFWRTELGLDKISRVCIDSATGRTQATFNPRIFGTETVKWLLQLDQAHPEAWTGNIKSGSHSVSLLALVLQESPESVRSIVEELAEDGQILFDGEETVRLAA